jgi:hypothetical protein
VAGTIFRKDLNIPALGDLLSTDKASLFTKNKHVTNKFLAM